jgi:hypothetical protein
LRYPIEYDHLIYRTIRVDFTLKRDQMITILLIILVLFIVGALPTWPYSANWGYYPSGGLGLAALLVLILLLIGPV